MGIKYSFVDGSVYGTEDINDITRCLTGGGVMPFESKSRYTMADLNAMTVATVQSGTSLDGCKVSVLDVATGAMRVLVSEGIIFFNSGVRLEVDENGYAINVQASTAGYVFAHYSEALQRATILFAAMLPTSGEYVLLATISNKGEVKDMRKFARSKVATMGSNAVYSIDDSRITVYETYKSAPSYSSTEKILATIDFSGIDITKFNYLIYQYDYTGAGTTAPEYCEKYFDFKNNDRDSFYVKGSLDYHSALFDIILEESKFIIVMKTELTFSCYKEAFKSAIPYFKLV